MSSLNHLVICFSFVSFIILSGVTAQTETQITYSKVNINASSREDIHSLQKAGLGLDHFRVQEGYLDAILDGRQIDLLKTMNIHYEIVIDDVIEHYENEIRIPDDEMPKLAREMKKQYGISGFEFGSMGGYYTFSEVVTELDSMRLLYPDLISEKFSIGLTGEGHNIWAIRISDNPEVDEDEEEILYTGLHHAREPMGMANLMYFMYYILENYGSDPFVTFLIENRELYFVPVINPDGYVYNEQTNPGGGGQWRKNLRDNNNNGVFDSGYDGVNLNVNYGYMWGLDDIGSDPNPYHTSYRGTGPFSELETQAIRDFCISHNFRLAFNYHTYWPILFLPWGYEYNSHTPDSAIFMDLAIEMTKYNNYPISVSTTSTGPINGYSDDWMYGEQTVKNKIFAMTPEVGRWSDGGFWASQSRIYPLSQEHIYANMVLALGKGVLDTDPGLKLENTLLSSRFIAPGVDTLFIASKVADIDGFTSTLQTIFTNSDNSIVDTVEMFDGGLDRAGDGIFGGFYLPPEGGNNYSAHVYLQNTTGGNNFINDVDVFTTIGPVVVDSIIQYGTNSVLNAGDTYSFYTVLKNQSATDTVKNITALIVSNNPDIVVKSSSKKFNDILSGSSEVSTMMYSIQLADSLDPQLTEAVLGIDIMSDGNHYWSDSIRITIYPSGVAIDDNSELPENYKLAQNYPNPFNPETTINYALPEATNVRVSIYNIMGQEVTTLINEHQEAGYRSLRWNGTDQSGNKVSGGMYLYRIQAGSFTKTMKMVLLK